MHIFVQKIKRKKYFLLSVTFCGVDTNKQSREKFFLIFCSFLMCWEVLYPGKSVSDIILQKNKEKIYLNMCGIHNTITLEFG